MSKNLGFLWTVLILTFLVGRFSFSQISNLKLEKANSLYTLQSPSEQDDFEAIALYEEVLELAPDQSEAGEFVLAAERLGNLYQSYGNLEEAVRSYRKAFIIKGAYRIPDTLLYNHHLYLGEALFGLSRVDSSLFHLQEAEILQAQLKGSAQPERLNNALGVYFFETGNYIRSISYFEKAESFLDGGNSGHEKYARYSFRSNKASALNHLGQYESAQAIYYDLLEYGINTDQIRINLASTYIEEKKPLEAIQILHNISEAYSKTSTSFHNLLVKAFLLKDDLSQSHQMLEVAAPLFAKDLTSRTSFQKGVYYSLWGDYYQKLSNPKKALEFYQKSIIQLLPGFEETSIESNPDTFSLGMSSLTLFEIQVKKAQTAWKLGEENQFFELGLNAWQSAFGLAHFISVNFDNDEARVFLSEKVLEAYQDGIDQLYHFSIQKNRPELMLEAFAWAEQSKANGLKIGSAQESLKRARGLPAELIQEERNLLFSVTRNNQKQYGELSEENRKALESELVDLQVRLSRLREKFKNYPGFSGDQEMLFEPKAFQAQLPTGTAVYSMVLSDNFLFTFWIAKESFTWKAVPAKEIPWQTLEIWLKEISENSIGKRYQIPQEVNQLSKLLLGGFENEIAAAEELIIIPQGVLNSFPFELLQDSEGKMLIEKIPVSYQFSAQFISPVVQGYDESKVLGFAPFTESQGSALKGFSVLNTSGNELIQFDGNSFIGKMATKSTFLSTAPSAEIIHLATHAVASSADPNQAFIAFFPGDEDFRLFAPELAFQSLEKAKLVYLSACETGAGKLSQSEGLISLARSLAFAGAEQMVISQWVSEDQVSAYIANRFYSYAKDGESFAKALQLAKLDLIQDPQMAQFHHPFYWANYRLIGQPTVFESNPKLGYTILVIMILLCAGVASRLLIYRRR